MVNYGQNLLKMLNFGSPMTTEMIKIGMQTNLAEMMRKLLNLMELDINDQLEKLMKVLPELTYLVVGSVLIFFVLVVLVPVMQVYMGTFAFSAFNVQKIKEESEKDKEVNVIISKLDKKIRNKNML